MSRMLPGQSSRNIKKAIIQPDVEPNEMKEEGFRKTVLMSKWSIFSMLALLLIGVIVVVIVLGTRPNNHDTTKIFEYLEAETLSYNTSPILFLKTLNNEELVIYYGIKGDSIDSSVNLLLIHVMNKLDSINIVNDVYLGSTKLNSVTYQYDHSKSNFYVIEIEEDNVDVDFIINSVSYRRTFDFESLIQDLIFEELG